MKNFIFAVLIFSVAFILQATDSFATKKNRNSNKMIYGDTSAPIDYVRTNIIIMRKSLPKLPAPEPLPWKEKPITPEPIPEIAQDPALVLDVEIRDGMSLYNQNGWFNLTSYSEKTGVMMAFSKPDTKPIIRSTQYAPVDILFIDKQGKITQIAPSIMLSELEEDIYPSSPILAFLFLKGGSCTDLSINVGDEVQYSLFKKPPLILGSPKETPAETQPVLLK
jgi:uncharacterized membrane protein (UPF0127 family)